jgi:hypothetical protein
VNRTNYPEFNGAYFEDSYFLGMTAEGTNLRLKLLLALTVDHPEYAPPLPGEAHCYRDGSLVIEEPDIVALTPAKTMNIGRDASDMLDFGTLSLHRSGPDCWGIETDWFNLVFRCARLLLVLDEPTQHTT